MFFFFFLFFLRIRRKFLSFSSSLLTCHGGFIHLSEANVTRAKKEIPSRSKQVYIVYLGASVFKFYPNPQTLFFFVFPDDPRVIYRSDFSFYVLFLKLVRIITFCLDYFPPCTIFFFTLLRHLKKKVHNEERNKKRYFRKV